MAEEKTLKEKTFEERRQEALKDPEYLRVKGVIENAVWFNTKSREKRRRKFEEIQSAVALLRHIQELASKGISAEKIKKQLALKESENTIRNWINKTARPRNLVAGIAKIPKQKTTKPEFKQERLTKQTAALLGHFLAGMYPGSGNSHMILNKNRATLDKIAELASTPERREETKEDKDRFRLAVPGTPKFNFLRKVTNNQQNVPLELLTSHRIRSNFLKAFFTHIGTAYNVKVKKTDVVGFNVEHKRKRELIPQLIPILAEYHVFPRLKYKNGKWTIIIQDKRELEKLVKQDLLPEHHKIKLSTLLKKFPPLPKRPYTLKDYDDFLNNKNEKEIKPDTARSWRKRKNAPDQVNRYLKLYKQMAGLGITFKAFPAILAHHGINLIKTERQKENTSTMGLSQMDSEKLVELLDTMAQTSNKLTIQESKFQQVGKELYRKERKPPVRTKEQAEELIRTNLDALKAVKRQIARFKRKHPQANPEVIESAGLDAIGQAAYIFNPELDKPFEIIASLKAKGYIKDAIRKASNFRSKTKPPQVLSLEETNAETEDLKLEDAIPTPLQQQGNLRPIKTIEALHNLHKNGVLTETEMLALLLTKHYGLKIKETAKKLSLADFRVSRAIKQAVKKLELFKEKLKETAEQE